MIHGDVTRSASASCTATATAYRLPSHAQIGTVRSSRGPVPGTVTEPSRETSEERTSSAASGSVVDADIGGRRRDLAAARPR